MPAVGDIWTDTKHLLHNGSVEPKHLLILGLDSQWITWRRLTTKAQGRPDTVGCHLSGFRPGYFIGAPTAGGKLQLPTWVDLGRLADVDPYDFARLENSGHYVFVGALDKGRLCEVLACAVRTQNDTTPRQERRIYAARGALNCP